MAGRSPLLPGASPHQVSHPEELTLNFRVVHAGADCCVLPTDVRNGIGSVVVNGTMVQEGKFILSVRFSEIFLKYSLDQ